MALCKVYTAQKLHLRPADWPSLQLTTTSMNTASCALYIGEHSLTDVPAAPLVQLALKHTMLYVDDE